MTQFVKNHMTNGAYKVGARSQTESSQPFASDKEEQNQYLDFDEGQNSNVDLFSLVFYKSMCMKTLD